MRLTPQSKLAIIIAALWLMTGNAWSQGVKGLTSWNDREDWRTQGVWSAERENFVTMRDGIHLSTDVYLPKEGQGKLPTILFRTPYGKGSWAVWSKLIVPHRIRIIRGGF